MEGLIFGIILLALLILFGVLSFYTVSQQEYAVIERLGKFHKISGPGFHARVPIVDAIRGKLSVRVQELTVNVNTKTKDNVFVDLAIAVQFYIESDDIWNAFYKLTNPAVQMESYIFDTVRATVPSMELDDVFTNKEAIAAEIKAALDEQMKDYGFTIAKALVNDIRPAANVVGAMNEINAAQRLREAAEFKGEAERILVVKAAEADAEAKRLSGEGIANQRKAIVAGYRESVQDMVSATGIDPREVMNMVAMSQYFDTLGALADRSATNTVLIPHSPGAVNSFLEQMITSAAANRAAAETYDTPKPPRRQSEPPQPTS